MIRSRRTKPRPGRLESDALAQLRQQCFERDNGICQRCGKCTIFGLNNEHSYSFHLAHRRNKRMHGDRLDNVQTECGDCHRKFHNFGPSMTKPVPAKEKP